MTKITDLDGSDTESLYSKFYSAGILMHPTSSSKSRRKVSLCGQRLQTLPAFLFEEAELEVLDLKHNRLGDLKDDSDGDDLVKERADILEAPPRGFRELIIFYRLQSLNLANNRLREFPVSICDLQSLRDLNVSANELTKLPQEIGQLTELKRLAADFNQLSSLPVEISFLSRLVQLTLCHNDFKELPRVLGHLESLQLLNMTGNCLRSLPPDLCSRLRYLQRLDVRSNNIGDTLDVSMLKYLEFLDISHNFVKHLKAVTMPNLQELICSHNELETVHCDSPVLKIAILCHNRLQSLDSLSTYSLTILQASHNRLTSIPDELCFAAPGLEILDVSHNLLTKLPSRMFSSSQNKLHTLQFNHNRLTSLPEEVKECQIVRLLLHHNQIARLPVPFFSQCPRLEELNLSSNCLSSFPPPPPYASDQCSLRKLFLSFNRLQDSALNLISGFSQLQILHLSYNQIRTVPESCVKNFANLEELTIAGNHLEFLPRNIHLLSRLHVFRLHNNLLETMPDLANCNDLQILDVASNQLGKLTTASVIPPNLRHLDISGNAYLNMDDRVLFELCKERSVAIVDVSCSRCPVPEKSGLNTLSSDPWTLGFTETHSEKTSLHVDQFVSSKSGNRELVIAIIEGTVHAFSLSRMLPKLLQEERSIPNVSGSAALRNAVLSAIRLLRSGGCCHLSTTITLCHLQCTGEEDKYKLQVASTGGNRCMIWDGEEVAIVPVDYGHRDAEFDWKVLVMEESAFDDDGTSTTSRKQNSSKLQPCLIPDPEVYETILPSRAKYIVVANGALWDSLNPDEVILQLDDVMSPLDGAKCLSEKASSMVNDEGASVAVLFLRGRNREKRGPVTKTTMNNCDKTKPTLSRFRQQDQEPAMARYNINSEASPSSSVSNNEVEIMMDQADTLSCSDESVLQAEEVEKYKSWEYLLEQNHRMLFKKELETIQRALVRNTSRRMKAVERIDNPKGLGSVYGTVVYQSSAKA